MWKKFLLFALFITLCFMIPCFFIDFTKINEKVENLKIGSGEIVEIKNGDTIKLLLTTSKEVIELTMNDYIKGVVLR